MKPDALDELVALVKQAFMDGLSYATLVDVTDREEAWRQSRIKVALDRQTKRSQAKP
jgi:hypothetical protein